MLKKILYGSLLGLLCLNAPVGAQEIEPDQAITYRGRVMQAVKNHMKAADQIVNGLIPFKQDLVMHAQALDALLKDVPHLFPEGSDFGETDAKPAIWEKADEFKKAADDGSAAATAFLEAAQGGDTETISKTFEALGESCSGCHKPFRAKR